MVASVRNQVTLGTLLICAEIFKEETVQLLSWNSLSEIVRGLAPWTRWSKACIA